MFSRNRLADAKQALGSEIDSNEEGNPIGYHDRFYLFRVSN